MNVMIEGIDRDARAAWRRYAAETISRALAPQALRCQRVVVAFSARDERVCCSLDVRLTNGRSARAEGRGHTRTEAVETAALSEIRVYEEAERSPRRRHA